MSKIKEYVRHLALVAIASLCAQCAWASAFNTKAYWNDVFEAGTTADGYKLEAIGSCTIADNQAAVSASTDRASNGVKISGDSVNFASRNLIVFVKYSNLTIPESGDATLVSIFWQSGNQTVDVFANATSVNCAYGINGSSAGTKQTAVTYTLPTEGMLAVGTFGANSATRKGTYLAVAPKNSDGSYGTFTQVGEWGSATYSNSAFYGVKIGGSLLNSNGYVSPSMTIEGVALSDGKPGYVFTGLRYVFPDDCKSFSSGTSNVGTNTPVISNPAITLEMVKNGYISAQMASASSGYGNSVMANYTFDTGSETSLQTQFQIDESDYRKAVIVTLAKTDSGITATRNKACYGNGATALGTDATTWSNQNGGYQCHDLVIDLPYTLKATISGEASVSTLSWTGTADITAATTFARLSVAGTATLDIDTDITAANAITVLGNGVIKLTGANLNQTNFNKLDLSLFTGKIVFLNTTFAPSAAPAAGSTYRFEGTTELSALPYSQAAMNGTVELAVPMQAKNEYDFKLKQNSVVFDEGFSMTANILQLGNQNNNTVQTFTQKGGTITLNGTTTATAQALDATSGVPFLMAHWPSTVTYYLRGGSIIVPNGLVALGRDGAAFITIGGGDSSATMRALGISNDSRGGIQQGFNRKGELTLATNGVLQLGEQGLYLGYNNKKLMLAGGTLEAYASNTIADPDNTIEVSAASTMSVPAEMTMSVTSGLSGSGAITKTGAGALVISGTMTSYTGAFTLSEGSLQIPAGSEGTMEIKNGTTLKLVVSAAQIGTGYTASGVTFAADNANPNVVFVSEDGAEITEGAHGNTLDAKALHVNAENSPYVLEAGNLPTTAVVVDADGVIDVNGVGDTFFPVILNGGKITNSGSDVSHGTAQLPHLTLTANSTIECTGDMGSINSAYDPHMIALNGHTLSIVSSTKSFWVKNATITGGGTIDVQGGRIYFSDGLAFANGNVTLNIAQGAKAEFNGTTPVPFSSITGAGELICGVIPSASLNVEAWTGKLTLSTSGNVKPNLVNLGNSNSKVVFNGVSVADIAAATLAAEVEIRDNGNTAGLSFQDWGYGINFNMNKVVGTGKIRTYGFAWYAYFGALKIADASEFKGSIELANTTKGGMWIVAGNETPTYPSTNDGKPHGALWVSEGATFGLGGTANSLNAVNTIKGTLKAWTASAALAGDTTFIEGSTVDLSAADSLLTIPAATTGSTTVTVGERTIAVGDKLIAWETKPEALTITLDSADYALEMTDDGAVVAEIPDVTITVPAAPEHMTVTVTDAEGETIEIADGSITVAPGTVFTVTYTPESGYCGSAVSTEYTAAAGMTLDEAPSAPALGVAAVGSTTYGGTLYATIEEALAHVTTTEMFVNLQADVTVTKSIEVPANFYGALNLNGHTITRTVMGSYVLKVPAGSYIEFGGNGGIVNSAEQYAYAIENKGTIRLLSVNVAGMVTTFNGGWTFVEKTFKPTAPVEFYLDWASTASVPYVAIEQSVGADKAGVSGRDFNVINGKTYHAKFGVVPNYSFEGETTVYTVYSISRYAQAALVTKTETNATIENLSGTYELNNATTVDQGTTITFTVSVAEGYETPSVTVNGTEVTADENGVYSYTVTAEDDTVAIAAVATAIPAPEANVETLTEGVPADLQSAYVFTTVEPTEKQAEYYDLWNANFEVSFDKDVKAGSILLKGSYEAWESGAWIEMSMTDDLAAGAAWTLLPVDQVQYRDVLSIKTFKCGVANLSEANIGTKMTVKLVLSNGETTHVISTTEYTLVAPKETDLPGAEEVPTEQKDAYNTWAAANGVTESTTTDTKVLATAFAMNVSLTAAQIEAGVSIEDAAKQAVEDEVPAIDMAALAEGDLTAAVKAINEKYNGKVEAKLVVAEEIAAVEGKSAFYKLSITIKN